MQSIPTIAEIDCMGEADLRATWHRLMGWIEGDDRPCDRHTLDHLSNTIDYIEGKA